MPELPEVETVRRGIEPHITGQPIRRVIVRESRLRWPVTPELNAILYDRSLSRVDRRAKYLLLHSDHGTLLIHLGMSGTLRIVPAETPVGKHDHVDVECVNGSLLRFNDPRRFGAVLWTDRPPTDHPLLRALGPEPLEEGFTADYLHRRSRDRRLPVKSLLMDNRIVVGVGNIYANEALFMAGIDPLKPAGELKASQCQTLVAAIREVLHDAITEGGTTLRDFLGSGGEPGYFGQRLRVYGRAGLPCPRCQTPIEQTRLGQRATYFCPVCQT